MTRGLNLTGREIEGDTDFMGRFFIDRWMEKWFGGVLIAAGIVWAGYHMIHYGSFNPGFMRLGPMQVLMLGLMLWLHGKFRNTVQGMQTPGNLASGQKPFHR